jgi:hypothetical protein
LAIVEANPRVSCREVEAEIGVSKTKVSKILKRHKYYPYKIRISHQLNPGDSARRINFSRWYLQRCQEQPNFGRNVIWSDETHISSAGIFNRHNTRHWSNENVHPTFARQAQGRFGFNISCFILGNRIAYHIFQGNLNAEHYIDILNQRLPELLADIPEEDLPSIFFQQDGAPAHNALAVRNYLENRFKNRWIRTFGSVLWPPRSPDLSILDFFLWGFLKNIIYQNRHNTIQELQHAVEEAFRKVQPVHLLNAIRAIARRCELCLRENGNQFEQFM